MIRTSRYPFAVRLLIVWAIVFTMTTCQAQQSSPHLGSHARKIQKILSATPNGAYIHVVFRNHTDRFGDLGSLSATSFELLDPKSQSSETYSYQDVAAIESANQAIRGVGYHRHRSSVGFLVIIGAAAAVGVGILAASRN